MVYHWTYKNILWVYLIRGRSMKPFLANYLPNELFPKYQCHCYLIKTKLFKTERVLLKKRTKVYVCEIGKFSKAIRENFTTLIANFVPCYKKITSWSSTKKVKVIQSPKLMDLICGFRNKLATIEPHSTIEIRRDDRFSSSTPASMSESFLLKIFISFVNILLPRTNAIWMKIRLSYIC